MNKKNVKRDRMRFVKNKMSANLAYLAIIFNVLYFISIYSSDVGNYYYTILIGASVIYNLLFLLTAFLSSEGLKNYKMPYAIIITVIGALQLVRIFGFPLDASEAVAAGETVMKTKQFVYTVTMLCLSSASAIASGIIGIIRTVTLEKHQKSIENNNIVA